MFTYRDAPKLDKDALVILLTKEQCKQKQLPFKAEIASALEKNRFSGEFGQIYPITVKNRLVVLIGLNGKELNSTRIRIAVRNALISHYIRGLKEIELMAHETSEDTMIAVVEGIVLGTYAWNKYKSDKDTLEIRQKYTLITQLKTVCANAAITATATNFARNLVNENASLANSAFLEKTIRSLVGGKKQISFEILKEKEMKAKGLGLHLAVNQASENEPRLIIVQYRGAGSAQKYTALIGKGVTYDTGGLNLKPTGSMETMKMDMSGTAAVIGTLKAAIDLKIKKNVLFVCAIAENSVDAKSYRPGDVITGYAGKSVEIGNTDAEGRLVLADAIAYVVKNYKPQRLIDIATLTGACVVALGNDYSGLCSDNEKLSKDLVHSSNATDDRVWRLPVYAELKDHIKSKIADIKNVGMPKGTAGTISAAEFLHQFTNDTPWAHLDIAGTAYVDGESRWYFGHGGTGAGVRLLTHYLHHYA